MFRIGLALKAFGLVTLGVVTLGMVTLGAMAQDTPPTGTTKTEKTTRIQKREIRKVEGKQEEVQKPIELKIEELKIEVQKKGEGTGEKRTIVIAHPKEGTPIEAKAFAFTLPQGQPHSKVITIVIGEDGKVIRTETNETKGKSIEIEILGGVRSLEQIQKEVMKLQDKNIELIKDGKKINLGGGVSSGINGSILLSTTTNDSKNLEAILKRLEKIEKVLEEIKAKSK